MLAIVPVRDGTLPAGGAETIAECQGRALLIGTGTAVAAQEAGARAACAEVGAYRPAAWARAIAEWVRDGAAEATPPTDGTGSNDQRFVLPASPDGRDLAPRLAAELGMPLFAGAVQVGPQLIVLARDGGLQMHTIVPPDAFVATLQPGVRGVDPAAGQPTGRDTVELRLTTEVADPTVEAVLPPDAATIDLAEAHRIVGGGAGLASAVQFDRLAQLGAVLGASVGATRVITDRGWIGHERQIGTTGVVVDPDLYLAFGISGAVQHTSGLGHPHHIISVNTAPHCPMMQLADLAVVADANAVLDELLVLLDREPGDG